MGAISGTLDYTKLEVADGITFEMVFFAISHHAFFSYKDLTEGKAGAGYFARFGLAGSGNGGEATPGTPRAGERQKGFLEAALHGVLPVDMVRDTKKVFKRRNTDSFEDLEGQGAAVAAAAEVTGVVAAPASGKW
jgi:hypothetical protein